MSALYRPQQLIFAAYKNRMKKLLLCSLLLAALFTGCKNKASTQEEVAVPEAEKSLQLSIEQYPDSFLLKEKLIQYYRDNGSYDMAIAATDRLLQKDTINSRLWFIKATLHSENEDTLKAIKAWENLVLLEPLPEHIMALGSLYAFTKDANALTMADALLQSKANAATQALFIKGLYYSSTGDKIKAISFFEDAISADYTNSMAYREKAICLYDLGKYVDALKVLELSLVIKKTNEEAYFWMGKCFEKLDKKEQAVQNYQLALQFDPNYIEARDALNKLGVK